MWPKHDQFDWSDEKLFNSATDKAQCHLME